MKNIWQISKPEIIDMVDINRHIDMAILIHYQDAFYNIDISSFLPHVAR